jgi:predicted phage-related endonuclease
VLLGYADFRWYELARDEEVIEQLRELGRRFWTENVEAGVPPEPDGSESYGSYLRRRYAPAGALEVVANAEQQVLWAQYLAAHELQLAAGERLERAAQRLMESMGTATKLLFGAGHVSWAPYEERRTDWRATAGELAGDLEEELLELELGPDMRAEALLAHRAAKHTTTSTKRPFRPHPPKDEE